MPAVKLRSDLASCREVTPTEGIAITSSTNVEQPFAASDAFFTRLRIYPAKSVSSGILVANTSDIYLGRSGTYLPDKRAATDVDYPIEYAVQDGEKMALSLIRVKTANSGDGFLYSYT